MILELDIKNIHYSTIGMQSFIISILLYITIILFCVYIQLSLPTKEEKEINKVKSYIKEIKHQEKLKYSENIKYVDYYFNDFN